MKIAIIGTRGVPNRYGGFEQFAQQLSRSLTDNGFEVWVYNSHYHPYKEKIWEGVNIIHCYDPEHKIGTAGQFIYDFNCIMDSRKRNFDVILQLGYTSSSIWHWLLPRKPLIITNMDGIEWQRSKYHKAVQRFLRYAEMLAVKSSDILVADSQPIKNYLHNKYKTNPIFIPYGTTPFKHPDQSIIEHHNLEPCRYFLCIARLQSDNHIEEIIEGVLLSKTNYKLIIVGSTNNKFGRMLRKKYHSSQIQFIESQYNSNILNNLRYHCYGYFHGHSAGGTNPSLLEAMAASAMICAHNNQFNKSVLGINAIYFQTPSDIAYHIDNNHFETNREQFIANNHKQITEYYTHALIAQKYIELFFNAKRPQNPAKANT